MKDPRKLISDAIEFLPEDISDASFDKIHDILISATTMICDYLGHVPCPDQCNLPAHDYCIWCKTPTPGMAKRVKP